MAKVLIAIHALHLASATGGVDRVAPGEKFTAGEHDDVERLLKLGAVRAFTERDVHAPEAKRAGSKGQKAPANKGSAQESEKKTDSALMKLTADKLRELAESEGVELGANDTKADIVAAIEAARQLREDDDLSS